MIWIQWVFIIAAIILVGKAAQLQIFDASYREKARNSTLDRKTLYPSRGLMYDRYGKLMVHNNPIYDLKVQFNQVDPQMDTAKFCSLLGIGEAEFLRRMNKDWKSIQFAKNVPFLFMRNISPDVYAPLQESLHQYPGFYPQLRNVRGYRFPVAAHVLGYLSEVNQETIDRNSGIYSTGDYIGTTGIEQTYEAALRGTKGIAYILTDNLGREVSAFDNGNLDSAAVSGEDLVLTLDLQLQAYGERLMQNKKGSIVCIEPGSGEILAMVSAPSYDPAELTFHKNRSASFNRLLHDTLKPLFDRSLMAAYPPGSIFKPILALVALQEGILVPNRSISCDGAYHYRYFRYGCHEHARPRTVSIALEHSCNSYFFQTFRELIDAGGYTTPHVGLSTLVNYLEDFGLGRPLGVDLPNEKAGNLPTPATYDGMYGKNKWRSTYIMSLGIGQGEFQLTTLQMANLAAIIANKGYYITPHVVRARRFRTGMVPADQTKNMVLIDAGHFEPVIEGMQNAVRRGTAVIANHPEIRICGKTGTSQNPHGKDHSVFYAFAPKENPQIAIAVYVENGGWGSEYAAPIASLMIEKYLNREILPSRAWLENRMCESDLVSSP